MTAATTAADTIAAYNADREPERLGMKMAAMRAGIFPFYRGTAHLFWRRVREAGLPETAPAVWCSGDLHLENFGTYRGDNSLTYFDVNDFDEAALAPCVWELVRFMTSVLVAAPSLGIDAKEGRDLASLAAQTYRAELAAGKARWIERRTADGAIGDLMTGLKKRTQKRMLARRTLLRKGRRTLEMRNTRMLPATEAELLRLEKFCKVLGKARDAEHYFNFLDGARRVAGTGSLGSDRFVILVQGNDGPDGNVLLDLKQATPSSLAQVVATAQPDWADDGHRIVAVQHRCQAVAPALLGAVSYERQSFVIKELQPSADRLELSDTAKDRPRLAHAIRTMGRLLAWAQLRSSGQGGSATVDDLKAYAAGEKDFAVRLVAIARDLHAVVVADYRNFSAACDDGQITVAAMPKGQPA